MSLHRDETTPHLVAYVVPIDQKGKLNCKEFLGGRAKLNKMQTDFANQVKDLGLTRGKEGSKSRHTSRSITTTSITLGILVLKPKRLNLNCLKVRLGMAKRSQQQSLGK